MSGVQVDRPTSLRARATATWKQRLPLINLKRRPAAAPENAVLYLWGGIPLTGPFVVELDNPYALTGYNFRAFDLYRPVLRALLLSRRCVEIRCLSVACQENLRATLGPQVASKSRVFYPLIRARASASRGASDACRFLFVGTQFEIKAGPALLRAFRRAHAEAPSATLDIITHLPEEYRAEAATCPGIRVHPATFSREEIITRFMDHSDVLVHPSFVESFGMVILEALSCGLGLIVADMYATSEMVVDGKNGFLLKPPISAWAGSMPSHHLYHWADFKTAVRQTDTTAFENALADRLLRFARDPAFRSATRSQSLELLQSRFAPITQRSS